MESNYVTNFTLRQLAHFVTAAEAGTAAGAAEQLHLSPSAISASISELESALGAELCVRRKGQGITLTPTGTQVLVQARQLLSGAAELDYAARGQSGELVGPLAIGAYVTLSANVLPPLLTRLQELHPKVSVSLVEAAQDRLKHGLTVGELDLVMTYDHEIPTWAESITLYRARPYVLLSAAHPLADRQTLSIRDVAKLPMVLFDVPPSGHNMMSIFASHGITPNVRYRTQTYELTRSLVARTDCYAVLIHRPRNPASYEGLPIAEREFEPALRESRVVLTWSGTSTLSPRAKAFVDIARRHFHVDEAAGAAKRGR